MAQAAVNVIGIIGTLITTIGFIQSNLPDQPNNGNSMVRIAAGKADGLSASEGTVPTIFAFNEQKGFIGQYSSSKSSPIVEAGSFLDVTVDQSVTDDNADKGSGQQPTYLQLIASDNAICIAYISQTWSDGTKRGWVGDVGQACGQNWFHSDVFVGDDHHQPACMWLDGDHTNDIASAGMQIHMEDFTNLTSDYSKDINHYCSPPVSIFHKDANWLGLESFWTDNQNKKRSDDNSVSSGADPNQDDNQWSGPISSRAINSPNDRRSNGKRSTGRAKFETEIVISARPAHTVSQHCGDHTFVGPDIASIFEGKFCDMDTRIVHEFCLEGGSAAGGEGETCFDLDTLALMKRGKIVSRGAKSYEHVKRWG